MTDSKLKDQMEEQDFSSFYRVDVYRQSPLYAMLDSNDPEHQKEYPFAGTDSFYVEKAYSIYMLDQKQVFERVKETVEKVKGLYSVRVYHLPLNSITSDEKCMDLTVFDSKGEKVSNKGYESFKAGDIVEYHDLKEEEVSLAVVYDAPKIKEEDLDDIIQEYYMLLTEGSGWMSIPASYVSKPSFPVSDAFKEKLESVYKKKVEDVMNGELSFGDLLNLL